ncbi:MAG: DUF58 domain-containing protein [Planctomycetota bacterium]|nr:DUF58 domain-containing protein [Planctomycetota bacterium]
MTKTMLTAERYLNPEVVRQVRRLDLRAKFIIEGFLAGLHDSPYRGFSMEFSEHRRYTPGDDPRNLDWTVWAKTDRLFVRTYQAETSLAAYLVVDTSRSMAYAGPGGAMTKSEYAIALAAALGYLLVHQGDSVGLGLVGDGLVRFLRPRGGRRQLVRVLAEMTRTEGAGGTDLAAGLHTLARRVRRRSLMLILSDLVDEPDQVLGAIKHLMGRGHDVVVFQILDAAERDLDFSGPVILEDPETGRRIETDADSIRDAYRRRLQETVTLYERGVRELGGDFVSMTTATAFDKALLKFLHERKRRF